MLVLVHPNRPLLVLIGNIRVLPEMISKFRDLKYRRIELEK